MWHHCKPAAVPSRSKFSCQLNIRVVNLHRQPPSIFPNQNTAMPIPDFDLVLFGGSGDLAMRKLLPAMYARDVYQDLPDGARIICVGRADWSQEEFLHTVETTSKPHIKETPVDKHWERFLKRIVY